MTAYKQYCIENLIAELPEQKQKLVLEHIQEMVNSAVNEILDEDCMSDLDGLNME